MRSSTPSGKPSMLRLATASLAGTAIEFYDFAIYGTAAALVLGPLFFPSFSPLAGTLAAFGTFGVGFLARPISAVLFGHVDDRFGRRPVLFSSLLLTGVTTVAVGCLPTYDAIGVLAPVLLLLVRFLRGLGLGGEWGGAVLLTVEHAPAHRRALWASFPQTGPSIGFLHPDRRHGAVPGGGPPWGVAAYLTGMAVLSLGCFALLPETRPVAVRTVTAEPAPA